MTHFKLQKYYSEEDLDLQERLCVETLAGLLCVHGGTRHPSIRSCPPPDVPSLVLLSVIVKIQKKYIIELLSGLERSLLFLPPLRPLLDFAQGHKNYL